jgi:hypothetical protein
LVSIALAVSVALSVNADRDVIAVSPSGSLAIR